jgi:hypothetical protein
VWRGGGGSLTYGQQYPGAIDVWRNAWPEFVLFLDYHAVPQIQ